MTPGLVLLSVEQACAKVASRGIVIYPTETLWGVGGNACVPEVASRIRVAKGGALEGRPFPVLVDRVERLADVVRGSVPGLGLLVRRFWPGGLTLAVPTDHPGLCAACGQDGRVAFRLSADPVACALAAACGGFLISTSANFSGKAPPETLETLDPAFAALTDGVVPARADVRTDEAGTDAPATGAGSGAPAATAVAGDRARSTASTLLSYESGQWRLVRQGAVPLAALADLVPMTGGPK